MVAITTDSPRYTHRQNVGPSARRGGSGPPLRLVGPAGPADAISPIGRLVLVLAAAAVVVAVAVASAAFGRLLDSHRGIPEAGAVPVISAQLQP